MDIFFLLFYQPAYNLILFTYSIFPSGVGLLLGILLIGVIVRGIMFPMVWKQVVMSKQNADLQIKIKDIQGKYKNDKEKLNQEMVKLNSEVLPAILSGCLPIILQLIIFISIDHVIRDLFDPNKGLSAFQSFMYNPILLNGVTDIQSTIGFFDVAGVPSNILQNNGFLAFFPYLVIILLAACVQFLSLKLSFYYSKKRKAETVGATGKESNKNIAKQNDDLSASISQTSEQMMYLFPTLLIIGALTFPAGLTIYWLVQSSFGLIQQYYFTKKLAMIKTN